MAIESGHLVGRLIGSFYAESKAAPTGANYNVLAVYDLTTHRPTLELSLCDARDVKPVIVDDRAYVSFPDSRELLVPTRHGT